MISEKILKSEIKEVKMELLREIQKKTWAEVYRLSEVLCVLEFVRDWDDD